MSAGRDRGRTWWRIGGSLLTVVVLGWVVVQVVGLIARSEAAVDIVDPADGLHTLAVQLDGGSVRVQGADGDEIRVSGTLVSGWRRTELTRDRGNGRLVLRTECPDTPIDSFCSADLVVEVPRGLSVEVRSDNTAVTLAGLDGGVDVSTTNASVSGEDLRAERVKVRTSNDRIELGGLDVESLDAVTSNDRVLASFTSPPRQVGVRTSNDSVEVVLPEGRAAYRVDLTTSNGSGTAEVRTDPAASRTVDVRTSNDDVVVRYPG